LSTLDGSPTREPSGNCASCGASVEPSADSCPDCGMAFCGSVGDGTGDADAKLGPVESHEWTLVNGCAKTIKTGTVLVRSGLKGAENAEASPGRSALLVPDDGPRIKFALGSELDAFVVGRECAQCNVAVSDPRVSRSHFAIGLAGSDFVLTDLGSTNGTWVDGCRVVEPVRLAPGSRIRFGRNEATFEVP
jgi:hypothetical protein